MTTPFASRGYDRSFNWEYLPPASAPAPPLVPIVWDGLPINAGDTDSGLFCIVESVTGWCDSAQPSGHDAERAIADGSAWGPKTLLARQITMQGSAVGDRPLLSAFRDQLALRASNRQPAPLTITGANGDSRALTASVRAGTDALQLTWLMPTAFTWQAVVTAADPLLYEDNWQQVTLIAAGTPATGRTYKRSYTWDYGGGTSPNSAVLVNAGNAAAPVAVLYQGDLQNPVLADQDGNAINLASLQPGEQILLASDDLSAWAPGGATRASYVLAGSVPMLVPPLTSARWSLYSTGAGSVTLAWRSAWS